ncbi:MAG: hypothetical protein OXF63_09630 [Anaerolineaceae bacterium]|nr:hypothetical protein [Anaerolineaceae bacterium]
MVTKPVLLEKLYAFIRHETTLPQLVDWAENWFVDGEFDMKDDVEMITDIMMYLAAADSRGFPLTWDILSEFVEKLGGKMPAIVEAD